MSLLHQHLQQHFDASQVGELDLRVRFDWQTGFVDAHIGAGSLQWLDTHSEEAAGLEPELTLFFTDEQCALDIFSGRQSPIDAFMQGDFRSSGYIIWTFALLRIFATPISAPPSTSEARQA
jgi:hypothetical protein